MTGLIDHVTMTVTDIDRSAAFYQAVLGTLGAGDQYRDGDAVGFGRGTWQFGLVPSTGPVAALHLAFAAASTAAVRAFHAAGLAAGGTCNGTPGLREMYGPGYFAAYLLDPDGHNVEAVHRAAASDQIAP